MKSETQGNMNSKKLQQMNFLRERLKFDAHMRKFDTLKKKKLMEAWNKRDFSPIHGQWILYEDEDTNAWECSVCHKVQQLMNGTPFENNWHYCPSCGAKMEQESKR